MPGDEKVGREAIHALASLGIQIRGFCQWHNIGLMLHPALENGDFVLEPPYSFDGIDKRGDDAGWYTLTRLPWCCMEMQKRWPYDKERELEKVALYEAGKVDEEAVRENDEALVCEESWVFHVRISGKKCPMIDVVGGDGSAMQQVDK